MPDQVDKEVEDLRLDGHRCHTLPQLAAVHIERTFRKQISQDFSVLRVVTTTTLAQVPQRKNGGIPKPILRRSERHTALAMTRGPLLNRVRKRSCSLPPPGLRFPSSFWRPLCCRPRSGRRLRGM